MNDKDKQIDIINEYLHTSGQHSLMNKIKSMFSSETDEKYQKYLEEKKQILERKIEFEKDKQDKENDIANKSKEKDYLNNELAKVYKQQKVIMKLFKDIMNSVLRLVLICRQKIFGIMGKNLC